MLKIFPRRLVKIIFRVFIREPSSLFASLGKPWLIIESVWQTHCNDDDNHNDDNHNDDDYEDDGYDDGHDDDRFLNDNAVD